jgi:uncharacterized protein YciI
MQFIYFINPSRPTFPGDATPEELAIVGEHFQFLVDLKDAGKLILAGRTQDDQPVGITIFEAENEAEAQEITDSDPAVKAGIFIATLRPYAVAVCRAGVV